jgi:hypothetical protein
MNRKELIQSLIDKNGYTSYLEIGVLNGHVFLEVRCRTKVAVDPDFHISLKGRIKRGLFKAANRSARYFETTSDDFFSHHASEVYKDAKLDIALIDGMHEFEFAIRDVLNCLQYLKDDGIMILHDCNPLSAEAACTFQEWKDRGYTGTWNGDVWKCILFLISNHPELDVFVLDADEGMGVVRRKKRAGLDGTHSQLTIEDLRSMEYKVLNDNRRKCLNLRPVEEIGTLF